MFFIKPIHANRGFWRELYNAAWHNIQFDTKESRDMDDITKRAKSFLWKMSQLKFFDFLGVFHIIKVKTDNDALFSYNRFLKSNVPYFLAVENPTAMVHYHPKRARSFFGKARLKKIFADKNLKAIICLSEACKKGLNKYYNIPENVKIERIYPYIPDTDYQECFNKKSREKLECLFVSSNFNLKGGSELIEAIYRNQWCDNSKIHFTIITKINELGVEIRKKISNCSCVTLYDYNFSKSELNEFYSKANILIHLTRMDSFPLVILEAIKHGCAIIATDLYAIGEMVTDGYNGYLCEAVSNYWNNDKTLNESLSKKQKSDLYSDKCDERIVKFLSQRLQDILTDPNKITKMENNSWNLANDKFSAKSIIHEWEKLFNSSLKEDIK